MREVLLAVGLVGSLITLQGCGGGGSSPAPGPSPGPPGPSPGPSPGGACKLNGIDLVTQSASMTTKLNLQEDVSTVLSITEAGTSTGELKIDVDQWNARIDQDADVKVSGTVSGETKVEEKMILNVAKKMIVVYLKVTNATSGKVLEQNCSAVTVAKMPEPALIKMAWESFIKPKLNKVAKCGGNDGTYDTWNIDFVHHKTDPWPAPIPASSIPPMDLSVNLSMQMGADYTLHSETTSMTLHADKINGTGPIDAKETSTTQVTQSSTTGPTADDLDYSSWGTCTPINPPDHTFLNDMVASRAVPSQMRMGGVSGMRNLVIAILQASFEQHANEIII